MKHICVCGDCFEQLAKLKTGSVDMILTDIPYGGECSGFKEGGLQKINRVGADVDSMSDFDTERFIRECIRVCKGTFIVFCGNKQMGIIREVFDSMRPKLQMFRTLNWEKTNVSPMNGQYFFLNSNEFAACFRKPKSWWGGHCQHTNFIHKTTPLPWHSCLPAGELVYVNNTWMPIEKVSVGDKTEYGVVVDTTIHVAEDIRTINTTFGSVKATHNHPFLILRKEQILWIEAKYLESGDVILQRQDITECECISKTEEQDICSSTGLCGSAKMAQFQKDTTSIIKTKSKPTIELKTSNLSTPLNTSGKTVVADLKTGFGIKNVASVLPNTDMTEITFTITVQQKVLTLGAKNVVLEKPSKTNKTENVYNLTIDGIPAFDTRIGCSHNTSKPVGLMQKLIELGCPPNGTVLDPCAGSFSVAIAAEKAGRNSIGFELNQDYFMRYIERLELEGVSPTVLSEPLEPKTK